MLDRRHARESRGNVYYPPEFRRLASADPVLTPRVYAESAIREGAGRVPAPSIWPIWTEGEPMEAWPGEGRWARFAQRHPWAPALALVVIAAFLMTAFYWGGK